MNEIRRFAAIATPAYWAAFHAWMRNEKRRPLMEQIVRPA